jgi:hypothetical protein
MAKTKTFTSVRAEEHIISEANGRLSREQIVLDAPAADVLAGTVLGKVTASGQYRALNLAVATGEEAAAAILNATEIALDPAADIRSGAIVRDAEVNGHKLVWPAGITDNEKAAAEAELAAAGVIVRY